MSYATQQQIPRLAMTIVAREEVVRELSGLVSAATEMRMVYLPENRHPTSPAEHYVSGLRTLAAYVAGVDATLRQIAAACRNTGVETLGREHVVSPHKIMMRDYTATERNPFMGDSYDFPLPSELRLKETEFMTQVSCLETVVRVVSSDTSKPKQGEAPPLSEFLRALANLSAETAAVMTLFGKNTLSNHFSQAAREMSGYYKQRAMWEAQLTPNYKSEHIMPVVSKNN